MKKVWVCILGICWMLGACSNRADYEKPRLIYEGAGQYWSAEITDAVTRMNGKDYFTITYKYLGDFGDLLRMDRITFAQGTSLGTETVDWVDTAYKEKLLSQGKYSEDEEGKRGIVVESIKNKQTPEFAVLYPLILVDGSYTNLEAIDQDRISIQIRWTCEDVEFQDEIT